MTATMEDSFVTGSVISYHIFSILMFSLTIFKSLCSSINKWFFRKIPTPPNVRIGLTESNLCVL